MMTILITSRWNSFLIALASWRLANCSPILLWERLFFFGHVFTYPWSPWGWQASSIWSLLDAHFELALHFFIWQNMFTIIRCFHYYKPYSEFLVSWSSFNFFTFLFFIMLMSWRYTWHTTSSYSSKHTCHRLNSLMTILRITPWTYWPSLDLLHFLLIATLKPTNGSSLAYGQVLQVNLSASISP